MQAKTYTGIRLKPLRIKQNKNFPEKKSDSLQTFQQCLFDSCGIVILTQLRCVKFLLKIIWHRINSGWFDVELQMQLKINMLKTNEGTNSDF